MSHWSASAWAAIDAADKTVPEGASLKDRIKIIDAAYPFGERAVHPYKAWLKARKTYELRHGGKARSAHSAFSPLERAKLGTVSQSMTDASARRQNDHHNISRAEPRKPRGTNKGLYLCNH